MKKLSVENHKKFACFTYSSEVNSTISLGNIVIKEPRTPELGIEWDEKPEIGVVIQTYRDEKGSDDFRTDMFGNASISKENDDYHVVTRFANLEEVTKYRPELLSELKTNLSVEKIQLKKLTGKKLGIQPDKDGFYFSNPNKKITVYDHERIVSESILETEKSYSDILYKFKKELFNATNLEDLKAKILGYEQY